MGRSRGMVSLDNGTSIVFAPPEGACAHPKAVPVKSTLGETVAWLCPACDTQLPAEWAA
jgi:hypothetical protein